MKYEDSVKTKQHAKDSYSFFLEQVSWNGWGVVQVNFFDIERCRGQISKILMCTE
jgi:hypothetical protein